jgi:murein DD-endopeptidase MepM/ murein hydrolase activator NlpD
MKSVNVRLWQTVKTGQLIGLSDNTGNSTGSHLHLGLCLTNILGYRLNKNNGFLGWVNALDSKIVKWVITNPKQSL